MRFLGQAFEVPVDLDERDLEQLTLPLIEERFAAAHHRLYRHGSTAQRTEVVSARLGVRSAARALPALRLPPPRDSDLPATHLTAEGECTAAPRAWLRAGRVLDGPAVLDDATSTIHIPAGWRAAADDNDNLILRRGA
jgi:N-methylhydantoinase A